LADSQFDCNLSKIAQLELEQFEFHKIVIGWRASSCIVGRKHLPKSKKKQSLPVPMKNTLPFSF
jgi:hypothetical protein